MSSAGARDREGGDDGGFDPQNPGPQMRERKPRRPQYLAIYRPETALRTKHKYQFFSGIGRFVTY